MKYFFLFSILCSCLYSVGQKEFCKPRKIERSAKKIMRKLSKEDYSAVMKTSVDSAVYDQLFMAQNSSKRTLKPITKYLSEKGCHYFIVDELEEDIRKYTYYKMHEIDTCMSEILQPYLDNYFIRVNKLKKDLTADSINGVYIPKNIDECFIQLNSFYDDSTKLSIRKLSEDAFLGQSHFGIGMWIRNNWGLWGASRLAQYFSDLGLYHPDDISGAILTSYHRYLNGQPIKLEEQIAEYQKYWENNK